MDYKLMIEALNLKKHTETLLRIKEHILPEVWEELEKYLDL
jgi:hypothetical protein